MIVDIISDSHGHFPKLKGGDLLIICGDLTARDTLKELEKFYNWLLDQKYKNKIFIGGNHDKTLQTYGESYDWDLSGVNYLSDSGTEIVYYPPLNKDIENPYHERKILKVWGSPWTLKFPGQNPKAMAFTCDTEEQLEEKWKMIPDDTNILITHSPPFDIFDKTITNKLAGSPSLLSRSLEIKPLIHCFGHVHEKGGSKMMLKRPGLTIENSTWFINASIVDENYKHINKPVRVVL